MTTLNSNSYWLLVLYDVETKSLRSKWPWSPAVQSQRQWRHSHCKLEFECQCHLWESTHGSRRQREEWEWTDEQNMRKSSSRRSRIVITEAVVGVRISALTNRSPTKLNFWKCHVRRHFKNILRIDNLHYQRVLIVFVITSYYCSGLLFISRPSE